MDLASNVSAIDDSYETIHFNSGIPPPNNGPAGRSLAQDVNRYNGPHSGHWTVKETAIGSGIDNGCPTVWQLPATGGDLPAYGGRVRPIAGDVIRRLARATEAQKKAEQVDGVADSVKGDNERQAPPPKTSEQSKEATPKGFYVPKIDPRGIQIAGKDGKREVVRIPQIAPASIQIKAVGLNFQDNKPREAEAEITALNASSKPPKAGSMASQASHRSQRGIRITGKNGEEVFTYIPIIRAGSKAAFRQPSSSKTKKAPQKSARVPTNDEVNKARRDGNAAQIAKKLRQERERQSELNERAKQAKEATNVMMSGALPAPSKSKTPLPSVKSSPPVASAKSSAKDSRAASASTRSKTSSKPPSVASSKTSVAASQRTANKSSSSKPESSTHSGPTSASKNENASNRSFKQPSKSHWQEIGSGTLYAPRPEDRSQRSASAAQSWGSEGANTPIHSFRAPVASDSRTSDSNRENSSHHASSPPQQTIFAGRGWISPHPLSVAPSEFEQPPEPLIKLPSREGATMTYDEWLDLRQKDRQRSTEYVVSRGNDDARPQRNNIARSSSDADRYAGGIWGFREVSRTKKTESVGEEWRRSSWREADSGETAKRYENPRVESVRSDGSRTYEHNFDGAGDHDWNRSRKVQLPMPWDARGNEGW